MLGTRTDRHTSKQTRELKKRLRYSGPFPEALGKGQLFSIIDGFRKTDSSYKENKSSYKENKYHVQK